MVQCFSSILHVQGSNRQTLQAAWEFPREGGPRLSLLQDQLRHSSRFTNGDGLLPSGNHGNRWQSVGGSIAEAMESWFIPIVFTDLDLPVFKHDTGKSSISIHVLLISQ